MRVPPRCCMPHVKNLRVLIVDSLVLRSAPPRPARVPPVFLDGPRETTTKHGRDFSGLWELQGFNTTYWKVPPASPAVARSFLNARFECIVKGGRGGGCSTHICVYVYAYIHIYDGFITPDRRLIPQAPRSHFHCRGTVKLELDNDGQTVSSYT